MAGFTDYTATNEMNWETGMIAMPALASRYLGLFTTAPTSDSGVTGAVEVSGSSYARVQIAGTLAANGTFTTGSPNITMNVSNPGWVTAGMNVYDTTAGFQIGTVSTYSGTALVLTSNAAHASSGSADNLVFSAFTAASNSSGSEPSVTPASATNAGTAITFATSTGSWGTITSFGIFDALTSGNLLRWDYLGNYNWSPFTCTSASPGVLTVTDQSFTNGGSAVVTSKLGGTLPTTGGSWAGLLTVNGVSGSTFNLGVNTTGTGDGLVRPVLTQAIANNITFIVPAGGLVIKTA